MDVKSRYMSKQRNCLYINFENKSNNLFGHKSYIDFFCPFISKFQHGFLHGKACLTQLLHFYTEGFGSLDKGLPIDVILFDFKKNL